MRISIGHVSRYVYSEPTRYSILALRLTPPSFQGQRVVEWRVSAPGVDAVKCFRDGFGNIVHLASCSEEHSESLIIAKGVVDTEDKAGVVRGLADPAPIRVYRRHTAKTTATNEIRALCRAAAVKPDIRGMHNLMYAVRDAVDYKIGATNAHTTAAEALAEGKGVCQDHAHLFIAAARSLDIPARYVSGYFLSGADEPSDANHAWAEAWLEGLGWVGFDPANRICPTEKYVRLASGLDATDAAPIRGSRKGVAKEELDVIVEVQQQSSQQQ
ncbi:transglutaminase family protein [Hyphomicrobium sp.]|uniref:transglutaminase family protein n=1 Tax=Hyphomicrobium sp. TaxID=82 RepID=UPI000FA05C12|nr:transglutaminase family protein [Hyphomicrobium sp.]MBN9245950.1 transglutaminase family protein [Hyphomicrobium sp.]RUP07432.1 MAG: transglutaminase family protein [Hyphomicrobium sp.]